MTTMINLKDWTYNLEKEIWNTRPLEQSEILLASYQKQYDWIIGWVVFMNVSPVTTEVEQILIWKYEFYKTRGRNIVTIVQEQTCKILDYNNTIFLTDDRENTQISACKIMAEWMSITNPNIVSTKFLRKNTKWFTRSANQLINTCIENINRDILAIIVFAYQVRYPIVSYALWFNNQRKEEDPIDIIKEWWINEKNVFYFPYNPVYIK